MGLIKAALGSFNTTMADQWKDYFYCDALDEDTLMVKAQKRVNAKSSNTKGNADVISSGSIVCVADGQCMLIVEQGKIVEVSAEPGEFVFDSSTEPSIFAGKLGEGIVQTFKTMVKRVTFGGDAAKDQRVYYINTKEIIGNKFGTSTPIPFRYLDQNIGLDIDTGLRCSGQYTYKISDPILFYTSLAGNVSSSYKRDKLDSTLKADFSNAFFDVVGEISSVGMRTNQLPSKVKEIRNGVNEALSADWGKKRGIVIEDIAIKNIALPDEDQQMIKDAQAEARLRNPGLAGAALVNAQSEAMKTAAGNKNGAMMGFMGMGMAQQAGGMNAQSFFQMDAQNQQMAQQQAAMAQQAQPAMAQPATPAPVASGWTCECGATNDGKFCQSCGKPKPAPKPEPKASGWKCECGTENDGKFCINCGKPQPKKAEGWTCSCGAVNKGKFCPECGSKKPPEEPLYKCDKCGWEPADPKHPPKFCPECGDPFNENDIV